MKRTDAERIDRELRRARKKQQILSKVEARKERSAAGWAQALLERLVYDEEEVFNTADDEDLLEVVLEMKEALPEKQWEPTLKKAIRLTKVAKRQESFEKLRPLLEI